MRHGEEHFVDYDSMKDVSARYHHDDAVEQPEMDVYPHHQEQQHQGTYKEGSVRQHVGVPEMYSHDDVPEKYHHEEKEHVKPYMDFTARHHVDVPEKYHQQLHVEPYKDLSARHHVDVPEKYHQQEQKLVEPYKDVSARHHVDVPEKYDDVPEMYHHEEQEHVEPHKDVSARHYVNVPEKYHHEEPQQVQPYKDDMARYHSEVPSTYPRKTVDQKSYVHHESYTSQHPVQQKSYVHHSTVGHHVEQPQVNTKTYVSHPVDHVGVVTKQSSVEHPAAMARIVEQEAEVNPDGSFLNVWNSSNGIKVQEHGELKRVGNSDVAVVNGQYSYVDDEGHEFKYTYVADENGYRVQADHLPTPPPLPIGIRKGLEWIEQHPYVETTTYSSQDQYYQQQESN